MILLLVRLKDQICDAIGPSVVRPLSARGCISKTKQDRPIVIIEHY